MTIQFSNFSFRYESLDKPTLKHINLKIASGEKVLILGASGSGKSTLGHCLNGLIPNAMPGEISGQLELNGQNVQTLTIDQISQHVGTVLQDTDNQFVGLSVGEDIAFALENQCRSRAEMYPLVKATAELVELSDMLERSPQQLSGGQKQRVSLAGVLVDDVDILLFDEPLAALDPQSSQTAVEIIDKLSKETNKTIIIIEHRLEDVLHRSVDRIVLMDNGSIVADGRAEDILVSPLLAQYGIREPLYLTALRHANCQISSADHPHQLSAMPLDQYALPLAKWFQHASPFSPPPQGKPLLSIHQLNYGYQNQANVIDGMSFDIARGEFVSILGKNGSGKSTLTKLIMGVLDADSGSIAFDGKDLASMSIFERSQKIGVVMQNPNHMISHHMIFDEIAFGLRNRGEEESQIEHKVNQVLNLCGLSKYRHWPISALSYGQKKRVTIASILALDPELIILDEPTAGQDHRHYTAMMSFIQRLNRELGITVVIISHDMHLVLEYTSRSLVFSDGKLIADAPMVEIFSNPLLLKQANLATTSLYQLAQYAQIDDTHGFMRHFIQQEQETPQA